LFLSNERCRQINLIITLLTADRIWALRMLAAG